MIRAREKDVIRFILKVSISPNGLSLCRRWRRLLDGRGFCRGARRVRRRLALLDGGARGERHDSRDNEAGDDDVFHIDSIYLSVVVVVVVFVSWTLFAGTITAFLTMTFEATRLSPSFT